MKEKFQDVKLENKIRLIEEMVSIKDFFIKEMGLILYPMYGTLLGIIRDNSFIPHDTDVDFAYLSKYTETNKIIKELKIIQNILKQHNLLIKARPCGQIHCKALNDKFIFDIWTSFKKNDLFRIMPCDKLFKSDLILPFKPIIFKNNIFQIPNKSEELLDSLYINWKTPTINNFRKFNLLQRI